MKCSALQLQQSCLFINERKWNFVIYHGETFLVPLLLHKFLVLVGGTKTIGASRVMSTVPLAKVAKATTILMPTISNSNNKSKKKSIILWLPSIFYLFLDRPNGRILESILLINILKVLVKKLKKYIDYRNYKMM